MGLKITRSHHHHSGCVILAVSMQWVRFLFENRRRISSTWRPNRDCTHSALSSYCYDYDYAVATFTPRSGNIMPDRFTPMELDVKAPSCPEISLVAAGNPEIYCSIHNRTLRWWFMPI